MALSPEEAQDTQVTPFSPRLITPKATYRSSNRHRPSRALACVTLLIETLVLVYPQPPAPTSHLLLLTPRISVAHLLYLMSRYQYMIINHVIKSVFYLGFTLRLVLTVIFDTCVTMRIYHKSIIPNGVTVLHCHPALSSPRNP